MSVASPVGARLEEEHLRRQLDDILEDEEGGERLRAALVHPAAADSADYFCIFCEERAFATRDDARRHYQHHLDYQPIVCSLCNQRLTDLEAFMQHHASRHAGMDRGRYKRRELAHVERWLSGFLYAQSAGVVSAFPPREQCPVCERVFSREQVTGARPRRCTVNRRIDHLHRHLCYLPYECVSCKRDGKEFLVGYFESKAHSHIKLKHPEVDDQQSRWFLFQKTISIPKLDDFIASYLRRFGVSMDLERRPTRKSLAQEQSGDSDDELFPPEDEPTSGEDLASGHTPNDTPSDPLASPVLVVDVSPDMVDLDFLDTASYGLPLRPSFTFYCVFCTTRLDSSARAAQHLTAHFDYHPILCLSCHVASRFDDISSYRQHHKSAHETQTDLNFEIREDFAIEKWVDDFMTVSRCLLMRF